MAKYICNGAQCKCTLGTAEGALEVKSQTKIFIQDKLMATENENTFSSNFVNCTRSSPPPPCVPEIKAPWSNTKNNVFQTEHKGLLEDSKCICSYGGTISIIDSKQTQTKNVIFGNYSSEPKEISKVYVKVRTLETYNGEFGFDWVDVDPETMEIQEIQGVPFSDAEYFYKKGNSSQDLGDIIHVSQDTAGAIQAIKENYDLINFCDYVDTPFVLLKPGEQAILSLEVFFEGESQDDYISITGDDFYSFKIDGEEERKDENDKTTKKKIVAKEQLKLTINCSKESLDKKYFFLHTGAKGPREVGGLSMMENKVLKLKFRIIALVSNEGNPNEKAKSLFKKFKNAGTKDYLNNNSLNQAGYTVEIENFDAMDEIDVDDYLYAFDKEDWKSKNLFKENFVKEKTYTIISYTDDGKEIKTTEIRTEVKDVIVEGNIDYTVINLYKDKLITKSNISEINNGGIIILSDYESLTETVAFSKKVPLNHYALFVYSDAIEVKDNYSHEIGHMLGLPHLFYNKKEQETYKNVKEFLLGNGLPEKNPDGSDNEKYIGGLIKSLNELDLKKDIYYSWNSLQVIKQDLIDALLIYNRKTQIYVNSQKSKKTTDSALYIRLGANDIINYSDGTHKTKREHFELLEKNIENSNIWISQNNKVIKELNKNDLRDYETIVQKMYFVRTDLINLLKQQIEYNKEIINQTHSNYIMFKQANTSNIMDYTNSKLRFLSNQITIMRKDYKNY